MIEHITDIEREACHTRFHSCGEACIPLIQQLQSVTLAALLPSVVNFIVNFGGLFFLGQGRILEPDREAKYVWAHAFQSNGYFGGCDTLGT